MSVQEKFNAMLDAAVRSQDAATRSLLKTVLGDIQTASRRSGNAATDALYVKTIKSFIDNNNISLKLRDNPVLVRENEILQSLLPAQMTDDEIRVAIASSQCKELGDVMTYLKSHHAGLYDGKRASALAKEWLASAA